MKKSLGLLVFFLLLIVQVSAESISKVLVKGYILDEDGNPLIGAFICDQEKTASAVAQDGGYFELKLASKKPILQVDYVGFQTRLHEVVRPSDVQVIVLKSSTELQEVVVTERGMGSMKRRKSVVASNLMLLQ